MAPLLANASKNYGIHLLKVDCDKFVRLSDQFGVRLLPGVFLFINGELKLSFSGYNIASFNQMIPLAMEAKKSRPPQPAQPPAPHGEMECHGDTCTLKPKSDIKPLRPEPEYGTEGTYYLNFTPDGKTFFSRNFYTDDNIGQVRQYCREKLGCNNVELFYETNPRTYFKHDKNDLIFCIDKNMIMWCTPC